MLLVEQALLEFVMYLYPPLSILLGFSSYFPGLPSQSLMEPSLSAPVMNVGVHRDPPSPLLTTPTP